jgi:hypothetical protein
MGALPATPAAAVTLRKNARRSKLSALYLFIMVFLGEIPTRLSSSESGTRNQAGENLFAHLSPLFISRQYTPNRVRARVAIEARTNPDRQFLKF